MPGLLVNLSSGAVLSSDQAFDGIIPDNVQIYIDIYTVEVALTLVSVIGVFTNVCNVIVLTRQSIRDCVSVCLLSLTLSDFVTSVLSAVYGSCQIIIRSKAYLYIDPFAVLYIVSWIVAMTSDITMATTSFISLERCLCVLMPFQFKDLFTDKRALFATAIIYILVTAAYMPSFVTTGISRQWDANYNTTRALLWFSKNRQSIEYYMYTYRNITLNTVCQCVVIACTQGMIVGLRRSRKLEAEMVSGKAVSKRKTAVIKMVTILAIVFIICNFLRMAAVLSRQFDPEVSFGHKYHNLYQTLIGIYVLAGALNSSVNIFVYYHFKPNFRTIFLGLFGIRKDNNEATAPAPTSPTP